MSVITALFLSVSVSLLSVSVLSCAAENSARFFLRRNRAECAYTHRHDGVLFVSRRGGAVIFHAESVAKRRKRRGGKGGK